MKILVFAHHLELGGTQTNAIELAAYLRDRHDHEVVLFATPGPAVQLAHDRGLRLVPAPMAHRHPSLARVRALRAAVEAERPDILHIWDWPQCLDAYFGVHLSQRLPMLCTSMEMVIPRILPRVVPATFGTPALRAEAEGCRPPFVAHLLEPPVDLDHNRPGVVDGAGFRSRFAVEGELLIVSVSRLTSALKGESLTRLVAVAGPLAQRFPIRLVLVGEGPAGAELSEQAAAVNESAGRPVVTLAGPLVDPRPAYEAADLVVGMGGSGLRAMAFAKPLVVVGEQGFSEIFDESTGEWFIHNGIYGLGDGDATAAAKRLEDQLACLLASPDRRRRSASYGHEVVTSRYGLPTLAAELDRALGDALGHRATPAQLAVETARVIGLRTGRLVVPGSLVRRIRSARGGP